MKILQKEFRCNTNRIWVFHFQHCHYLSHNKFKCKYEIPIFYILFLKTFSFQLVAIICNAFLIYFLNFLIQLYVKAFLQNFGNKME